MLTWLHGEEIEHGGGLLPLGQEYLLTDDHHLVTPASAQHAMALSSFTQHSTPTIASGPSSTLVGSSGGLQIDLIWDASVRTSANWAAVESSVVQAARVYTGAFSNHEVLNIQVGYGEVAGQSLDSGALGESESSGYLMGYAAAATALGSADAGLVHAGEMSAGAVQALQGLKGASVFVTSAEAKSLDMISGQASGVDGYIGLSTSPEMFFAGSGGAIRPGQYDAAGVAAHELSEVMGRTGMEGQSLGSRPDVYTLLDIFRYSAPHTPDTTPTAGYFSTDGGLTSLETFNNPSNGGDAADWASSPANRSNAYDAFDNPGVTSQVTAADLLAVAVLGYQPAPGHILTTVNI